MRGIHELEDLYRFRLQELPPGAITGELADVPWLLEELRISAFAQAVGMRGQVSAKRIRRILDEAAV
jgi:ATP-dependent helicase HrpA